MRLIDADALKKDDELTEWITRDTIRTGKMLKSFSELFVKKIDDAPTVNAVSEEVYTREYNLRKDAEMKVYKLEKALKQESCEDAVSRQAVLEPYKYLKDDDVISVWLIKKNIEQQKNVTPTITTDTITEYCKEHNYVLCEKGTEGDAISRQAVIELIGFYKNEMDCFSYSKLVEDVGLLLPFSQIQKEGDA